MIAASPSPTKPACAPPRGPLPVWERRLATFLAAPNGTPWPDQWVTGRDRGRGVACVRCGEPLMATGKLPRCGGACGALVVAAVAADDNDWTKRFRRRRR